MLPEDDPRYERPLTADDRDEYEAAMRDRPPPDNAKRIERMGEAFGVELAPVPTVGKYLSTAAVISACQNYRYTLVRRWRDDKTEPVAFVMLNPSTATADVDDPTIRRCVGYAKDWGYSALVVVNLFAFRATDPLALRGAPDPIGPDNDRHILEQCAGRLVVVGWGAAVNTVFRTTVKFSRRPEAVLKLIREKGSTPVTALGLSVDGSPRHPLYLKSDLKPIAYTGNR